MNHSVWDTLHDGGIEAASGCVPGDVRLSVGIAYLCDELPTAQDRLELRLYCCRRFEYQPHAGPVVIELAQIATRGIEILGADAHHDRVVVQCAGGTLLADYELSEVWLYEGKSISQAELEMAADRYWTKWRQRNDRAKER